MSVKRFSTSSLIRGKDYVVLSGKSFLRIIPISSRGGISSTSGGYTIHTFTSIGSSSFTVNGPVPLDYLVIGGGGDGNGGAGTVSSISGVAVTYAGGGGGSSYLSTAVGNGGPGGGGAGGNANGSNVNPTAGAINSVGGCSVEEYRRGRRFRHRNNPLPTTRLPVRLTDRIIT